MIKEIYDTALKAYRSMDPVKARGGTVISINPLRIKLSEKLILDQENLFCTETFYQKWQTDLQEGQSVCIIQAQGGQQFWIIDRVRGIK